MDVFEIPPSSSPRSAELRRPHVLPFSFVVPIKLLPDNKTWDERFLDLPPSSKSGTSCWPASSCSTMLQPLITYTLAAAIRSSSGCGKAAAGSCHSREIKIMPTMMPRPPVYVYPPDGEYRTRAVKVNARKSFFGRGEGIVLFQSSEPAPLNVLEPTYKATTIVRIKCIFKPSPRRQYEFLPRDWVLRVRAVIYHKQYYSSKPLAQEPTLHDLHADSHLRCTNTSLQPETREYRNLAWCVDCTTLGADEPLWVTEIAVVVASSKSLLPSYLCALAALKYSVVLDVSIVGLHFAHATLEVPLQVVRHTTGNTRRTHTSARPSQLERACVLNRIQSADAVWEDSDLEREEASPQYQPG